MRHTVCILGGLSLCAPLLLTGCDTEATGEQTRKPPKVTVAEPVIKDVIDEAEFTGEIRPQTTLEVRARAEGILEKIYFKEGTMVNAGDKLFLIEQATYRAALAAAEAQLKQTLASEKLAKANLARDKAAQKKSPGVITQEEIETREAEVAVAQARMAADEAAIEKAKIDLGYTAVRAEITGLMSRRYVDEGNLVGAGEQTLMATIVQMSPMDVYFDVSEDVVLKYLEKRRANAGPSQVPTPFFVGLKNEVGYPHEGTLDLIDNQIDRSTGTALVRGRIENKRGFLYGGQFARIKVPLEPIKNAILVDEQALGTDLAGKYLLIVGEDNVVEQRPVVTGPLIDGMRVIREGLKPGERYIVEGLQRARPGLPVAPETAGAAKKAAAKAGDEATPGD